VKRAEAVAEIVAMAEGVHADRCATPVAEMFRCENGCGIVFDALDALGVTGEDIEAAREL